MMATNDKTRESEVEKIAAKKRKRIGFKFIDDEAQEGDDSDEEKGRKKKPINENNDDEDEDEEDEDQSNYVADDFLIDDAADNLYADGEEVTDSTEKRKTVKVSKQLKKLKKQKNAVMLEDEDLAIMQENILSTTNSKSKSSSDQFNGDDEELGDVDLHEYDDIDEEHQMDDGDINASRSKPAAGKGRLREYYDDDDDEMGDFIDDNEDDEDEVEGEGEKRKAKSNERRGRPKGSSRSATQGHHREGPTYDQVQEAIDIFGEGYDEFDEQEGVDAAGGELALDEEEADDGGKEARVRAKERRSVNRLRSKFERSQLVNSFCTDLDEELRARDVPERMQLLLQGRQVPDQQERQREAAWVTARLTDKLVADQQLEDDRAADLQARQASAAARSSRGSRALPVPPPKRSNKGESFHREMLLKHLLDPVESVLKFLQEEQLEVPFIWTYRKDYLHPAMKVAHLWFICEQDELWEAMHALRLRANLEIQALCDAADSSEADSSILRGVLANESLLRERCISLRADCVEAEELERRAMDVLDAKDSAGTAADRLRVREASEQLERVRQQLQAAEGALRDAEQAARQTQQRMARKARYDQVAAREVLRLFPADKYQPLLEGKDDEQLVRYIAAFLALLSRGAQKEQADLPTVKAVAVENDNGVTTDEEMGGTDADRLTDEDDLADLDDEGRVGLRQKSRRIAAAAAQSKKDKEKEAAAKAPRSRGRDEYSRAKGVRAVRHFCELFMAPACEVGDAMRCGTKSRTPIPRESVTQAAQALLDPLGPVPQLRSERQLLEAAACVLSTELAHEPSIRSAARKVFLSRARVSTRPTDKGLQVISPFNELFGLHWLEAKPLAEFFQPAHNCFGPSGACGLNGQCLTRTGEGGRSLFLRLVEAEREGLLNITVSLPDQDDSFVMDIGLFLQVMPDSSHGQSDSQDLRGSWNHQRLDVLKRCVDQHLVPSLVEELRRELVRLGREAIVEEAALNFERMLRVGPFRKPSYEPHEMVKEMLLASPRRVFYPSVACIYLTEGRGEAMHMAFVNKDGVLRAHETLPDKAVASQKSTKIRNFLLQNRPDLVVLNAGGGQASRGTHMLLEKTLLAEVQREIELLTEQQRAERRGSGLSDDEDDSEAAIYSAHVIIADDQLAKIFKASSRAKRMFPDLEPGTAAAVCLARFAQEPLAEYCNLWTAADAMETFGFEALFLDLHPLKRLLRGMKLALVRALERKLVDAVCEIGVDLNRAIMHDHLGALLAFVGGLGLRKADALRQNVRRSIGQVDSRNTLLVRKLMGVVVWTNAAGFLRISGSGPHGTHDDEDLEFPLDNTRIHPECYITHDIVPKICYDAQDSKDVKKPSEVVVRFMRSLRRDWEKRLKKYPRWLALWLGPGLAAADSAQAGEAGWGGAELVRPVQGQVDFKEVIKDVNGKLHELGFELDDPLARLQLADYAQELQAQGLGRRHLQICHIKDELRFPWLDLRDSLHSLDTTSLFASLTGESDRSLFVGLKLGCSVLEISDTSYCDERSNEYRRRQRAVVRTDIGLRGSISVFDVTDEKVDPDSFNLNEVVQVGMHLVAVVVAVRKDKLQLDLSLKPSHLQSSEAWWMRNRVDEPAAKLWWEQVCGRNPRQLFDQHFDEEAALQRHQELEDEQARRSEAAVGSLAARLQLTTGLQTMGSAAQSQTKQSQQAVRLVHHPLFANLDYKATEERLRQEGKGAGEVLIRPSSKGPDHLTITWAFQDRWFKHISVQEKGKRPGDIGLGSQLYILEDDLAGDMFSDLDEIFSRYIEPMNDYVSTMVKHRCFLAGSVEEVEAAMRQQLAERPNRIPYFIRFEPTLPGYFTLTWLSLNVNSQNPVKKDLIAVRPYGYKLRGETFARPSELIEWFKRITEAAARAAAQNQPVVQQAAPLTSMRKTRFSSNSAANYTNTVYTAPLPAQPAPPPHR